MYSKSCPNLQFTEEVSVSVKSNSFHDFNDLILQGDVSFISFGTFLNKFPNSSKQKRLMATKNHYYNK